MGKSSSYKIGHAHSRGERLPSVKKRTSILLRVRAATGLHMLCESLTYFGVIDAPPGGYESSPRAKYHSVSINGFGILTTFDINFRHSCS